MIHLKRVYEEPSKKDGVRILFDSRRECRRAADAFPAPANDAPSTRSSDRPSNWCAGWYVPGTLRKLIASRFQLLMATTARLAG